MQRKGIEEAITYAVVEIRCREKPTVDIMSGVGTDRIITSRQLGIRNIGEKQFSLRRCGRKTGHLLPTITGERGLLTKA